MLTVAPPDVAFAGDATGLAALEQPVEILAGPVLSDGDTVGPEVLVTSGFHVYRRAAPGAGLQIWSDQDKHWAPEGDAAVTAAPAPLALELTQPGRWRALIVAAGGRDNLGEPQYAKAVGGYPHYSVRVVFALRDASAPVLSAPSRTFGFVGASDANLMVVGPGENEQPAAATQVRVLLRDAAMRTLGGLVVERGTPGASLTLSNRAGASIALHPDGRIVLTPAAGQQVLVAGDLEVERLRYQPSGGGGVKQWLL